LMAALPLQKLLSCFETKPTSFEVKP